MVRLSDNIQKSILANLNDIIKTHTNISFIYGGQTEHSIKIRQKQHKNDDPDRFVGMDIRLVYKFNDNEINQINKAEEFLIKLLKDNYGLNCLNIADTATGLNHQPGDKHRLYVMFR
jgi:hypothetical protein